jgi:exosortase family protein XrtF
MKEFKPAILFLIKFLLIYVAGNVAYGFFITAYAPGSDPITELATRQSGAIIKIFNPDVNVLSLDDEPVVLISNAKGVVLRVFEGCNGLNVMIVFLAFLIAFGGRMWPLILFSIAGIAMIHFGNLARIILLYYTATGWRELFYYFHKYLFTACLYLLVFLLWYWWIRLSKKSEHGVAH